MCPRTVVDMAYQGELVLSAWKKKEDDTTAACTSSASDLFFLCRAKPPLIVGQLTEYLQQVSKVCKI